MNVCLMKYRKTNSELVAHLSIGVISCVRVIDFFECFPYKFPNLVVNLKKF